MSLGKQLWLLVTSIIALCLGGSFIITTISSTLYLEAQLYEKNVDSANNLALILSTEKFNPTVAELQINSQFDTGFFQRITLEAPQGGTIYERVNNASQSKAPLWFSQLIDINPSQGSAHVNSGWRQIGKVSVQSNKAFAYDQLWNGSIRLLIFFIVIALLSGACSYILLKKVIKPLNAVVSQAEAIGRRCFVTIPLPKTREFRALAQSMNSLSNKVKSMLLAEADRIQTRLAEEAFDQETGLYRRDAFLSQAKARIGREDQTASGRFAIFTLKNLQELNALYGREKLDQLIRQFGQSINELLTDQPNALGGRLDGSQFALLLGNQINPTETTDTLFNRFQQIINESNLATNIIKAASIAYEPTSNFISLLEKLEHTLSNDGEDDQLLVPTHIEPSGRSLPGNLQDWKSIFDRAFKLQKFQLHLFPVVDSKQRVLHFEAPIRLQYEDNELLNAGEFLGWAQRCELLTELDQHALKLACERLNDDPDCDLGINVNTQLLHDTNAQQKFIAQILKNRPLANRLWLEFPEQGVYHYIEEFKSFIKQLKPLGCRLGIEHAGHAAEKIGALHDIGLDYIKIDSAFIHDIDSKSSSQFYSQGLVTIAHSIGLKIIAEGVSTPEEIDQLVKLGFDGMTGPAIRNS
ncbi:LapD/MoxY N-terminal periplasmic domain-containing protein [Aurantivibrio plasticivorans]